MRTRFGRDLSRALRRAAVAVGCPCCGHESRLILAWLQAHEAIACQGCGVAVAVNGRERREIMQRAEALADELATIVET